MDDSPGPRLRADQSGDERDVRRYHDWTDLQPPPEPEPPLPRPVLLPPIDTGDELLEASEAVLDAPDTPSRRRLADIDPLRALRLLSKRLRDTQEEP